MKIFVVSSYGYWGKFTPNDLGGDEIQVGGGETAMVSISRELAALGHDVTVFYDTKPGRYCGVDYLPTDLIVPLLINMEHDILVSWDAVHAFRFADKAKVHVMAYQLNDAFVGVFDWTIDRYFHPSQWHVDMFHNLYPEMTVEKSVPRMTNGIDYERYAIGGVPRNPLRVIYSSSPDRGLHHLLRFWPRIVEKVPGAELYVFYDINRWLQLDADITAKGMFMNTSERAKWLRDYEPHESVHFCGGVGQRRLAIEQLSSSVMVYPCDPVRPTEGFSMSVLEGVAAGLDVVTSNADALPELWTDVPNTTLLPLPIDDDLWVETIVEKLKSERQHDPVVNLKLSWKHIARQWEQELLKCLSR